MAELGDAEIARLRAVVADATFATRFELRHELGEGGMGRVFAAHEHAADRQVAIKLLDAKLIGDRQRFAKEAELLETLDHPAIVAYITHGITADGTPYLAMEWLDGEPLSRVLARGALALDAAIEVGIRVADALAYLHARGVVHRDIKPSNVMLVGGEPAHAKVIDLGIAKELAATTGLTGTGQMIGTPGYMAPEQMMGTAIDARVDLFSLGCLLYEAVTGVAPFHGTAVVEVLARVLLETPASVSSLRGDAPARLGSLIEALMAKSAHERAPSATAVAVELRAIREAIERGDAAWLARPCPLAPIADGPETRRERPPQLPAPRRKPWLAIAAAGIVVVIAGTVAVRSRRARTAAEPVHVDLARAPRSAALDLGTVIAGTTVGMLGLHQQAGEAARAIWCAPRQAAVIAYKSGDVLALDRTQRIWKLGHVTPVDGERALLACATDGRIAGAVGGTSFFVTNDRFETAAGMPAKAVDVVAVGTTMHWLTRDAIWSWNGDGQPAREVRRVGCTGTRLAPDGNQVACSANRTIKVDDGTRVLDGPDGSVGRWSETGTALYLDTPAIGWQRWNVGASRETKALGAGATAFDLRGREIVVQPHALVVTDAHGARSELPRLPAGATVLATIPEHDALVVAAASDVWIVALDRIELLNVDTRHVASPRALAFSPDGTRIASLAQDKLLLRALDGSQVETIARSNLASFPTLVWRADGSVVFLDIRALERVHGAGTWTRVERLNAAVDAGTGDIVAADGTTLRRVGVDGALGETLGEVPLLHDKDRFAVRGSRVLILPADGEPVRIHDMATRRTVRELGQRPRIVSGALLFGERPAAVFVTDDSRVQILDDASVTDLGIRVNRPPLPSPTTRHVALATMTRGEVLVYDVGRSAIVVHGLLPATVTALAWSRDGTRLAALATTGEVRVWTVDPN